MLVLRASVVLGAASESVVRRTGTMAGLQLLLLVVLMSHAGEGAQSGGVVV